MAPYAVSGGRVDRPRESRPSAEPGDRHHSGRTRRRSTHGSRSRSRPAVAVAAAAADMDPATNTAPRRPQVKYQPLKPTIRTVSPDGGERRPQRQKSRGRWNGAARSAALDGGGDRPDARLMGNDHEDGLERGNTRRKKSSAAAAAAAAAPAAAAPASTSAAPPHHRSQRSDGNYGGRRGGGGEKGKAKGKRPFSADSDDFVAPQRKRRCGRCFCMGVSI